MKRLGSQLLLLIPLFIFTSAITASADINTILPGETVFVGEEGLDVTACGLQSGDIIGWWGPGSSLADEPTDTTSISSPASFYISPVTFDGESGPWYLVADKELVFYVKEPRISLRVSDTTRDYDATGKWVPTGDTIGFILDSNLYEMRARPGVAGAPVGITITAPDGIEYTEGNFAVDTTPYKTGGVWSTAGKSAGFYTIQAKCTANQLDTNANTPGKALSVPVQIQIQTLNPLIRDFSNPEEEKPEPQETDLQEETIPVPDTRPPTPVRTSPVVPEIPSILPPVPTEQDGSTSTVLPDKPRDAGTPGGDLPVLVTQETGPATLTQGPAPAPTATTAGVIPYLIIGAVPAALYLYSFGGRKNR
ncbi:MAG: DUF3821 domain-containing protein [Methanospirillaceae archaeon]|nr:DUF3821 domain-containing protein [Methanospirillaceae archaeon]